MMRARAVTSVAVLAVATLLVLSPAAADAQPRPDFSGTWVALPAPSSDASAPARPAPQAFGPQFTITHRDAQLTVTRPFAGSHATIAYVLDGSEITSRMPGRLCEPDSGATWTAAWEGDTVALMMTGALPANGKPVKMNVKTTLRLEPTETLRVSVTSQPAGAAAPRTTETVYKKSGPPPAPAASPLQKARASISQVAWIGGTWTGVRGSASIEERWTPPAGGAMLAISRTLRDGLMPAFEFLCIVERDGGLVYSAMPNGRMPATDFTLTKIDEASATFENPTHDFPKMIRYTRHADGSLEAVISGAGGEKPQAFVFKRAQ
jgi:hypothetical protein